jgi:hypothetical protein
VTAQMIWYAAYGSNLLRERFMCYLQGGKPDGAARAYPGARDPRAPRAEIPLWLAGGVYFATRSAVWGGGRALYDPGLPRRSAACAYLVTAGQFSDVVAQEMAREPGADLDLGPLLSGQAGQMKIGDGHYETLVSAGRRDGTPVITFTAPWRFSSEARGPLIAPSAAYLTMLGRGLCESHGWNADAAGKYLAGLPGAKGKWGPGQIARLLGGFPEGAGRPYAALAR